MNIDIAALFLPSFASTLQNNSAGANRWGILASSESMHCKDWQQICSYTDVVTPACIFIIYTERIDSLSHPRPSPQPASPL